MVPGTKHKATVIDSQPNGVAVMFRHARNPERIEWIAGASYPKGTTGMVYYEITNRSGLWKFTPND